MRHQDLGKHLPDCAPRLINNRHPNPGEGTRLAGAQVLRQPLGARAGGEVGVQLCASFALPLSGQTQMHCAPLLCPQQCPKQASRTTNTLATVVPHARLHTHAYTRMFTADSRVLLGPALCVPCFLAWLVRTPVWVCGGGEGTYAGGRTVWP